MNKGIKVLQLIDSLRPAGAERMAVSYANALVGKIEGSFLCCTRMEGGLRKKLVHEVGYLYLNKKNIFDLSAFLKLKNFIIENNINLIHAHGTSFFLAVLMKIVVQDVKIIWHDHLGERAIKNKNSGVLSFASYFFDGIIAVNQSLAEWSRSNLHTSKVIRIRNFLTDQGSTTDFQSLKGGNTLKIISVANLRKEKDHLNLLRAFKMVQENFSNSTLHLIGKINNDRYFHQLEEYIFEAGLKEKIFFYGQQDNVDRLITQADIGVLSSYSEGLPVALLEYGRAGLAVVCTRVGECAEVIGDLGKVVSPGDSKALADNLLQYLENEDRRKQDAAHLKEKILLAFTEDTVIPEVLEFYNYVLS